MLPALLLLCAQGRAAGPVVGTVVTSKEWIVHRGKQKTEEFSGDVRYHSGPNVITADWALYEHDDKRWHAKGRVVAQHQDDSGDLLVARGDSATLLETTRSGEMSARDVVLFERHASTDAGGGVDYGEAGHASWQGQESADLTGGLHLWGPRIEAWADRGHYASRLLTLSGSRPVVRKFPMEDSTWEGTIKADVITASRDERIVNADGRARGWLVFPKPPPGAKKGRKT